MGYVKSLVISCAVTFALYFLALLFKGLGYIKLFDDSFQGEMIGKSLVEPIVFICLMLCFWFSVAKDQRGFYVLLLGFPVLLILQMVIAFGSLDDSPEADDVETSRTYCKSLFEGLEIIEILTGQDGGFDDEEALCKTSLALSYFNLVALSVDLFFVVKIVLSFKGFEKVPEAKAYEQK